MSDAQKPNWHDNNVFVDTDAVLVPTEGYRVIREEDVPVIVHLLRGALESQGGVGMDHEAGLLDHLTNTEDQP